MDSFEEQLRHALQHRNAPEGFADRVLLRVAKEPLRMPIRKQSSGRRWIAGALAASLLAGAAGGLAEWQHRQQQRAEAQRQFALAMQVTARAFWQTREQLGRSRNRAVQKFND